MGLIDWNFNSAANQKGHSDAQEKWSNFKSWLGDRWNDVGNFVNSAKEWMKGNAKGAVDDVKEVLGYSDANSASGTGDIAYTEDGIAYDPSSVDSQVNALNQGFANQRNDTAYQRTVADLQAAGLNPALMLSNSGASVMSSDAGARSNYAINAKDELNSAIKIGMILAIIAKMAMK